MSETAWLVLLIGALALGGVVVSVLLWRRVSRALYLGAEPPPPRPRDPALVAIARDLEAQGLTRPGVPRALTPHAPRTTTHARDSPPSPEGEGGTRRTKYDVN